MILTSFLTGSWTIFMKQFNHTENKEIAANLYFGMRYSLMAQWGKEKKVAKCQRGLGSKEFGERQ